MRFSMEEIEKLLSTNNELYFNGTVPRARLKEALSEMLKNNLESVEIKYLDVNVMQLVSVTHDLMDSIAKQIQTAGNISHMLGGKEPSIMIMVVISIMLKSIYIEMRGDINKKMSEIEDEKTLELIQFLKSYKF